MAYITIESLLCRQNEAKEMRSLKKTFSLVFMMVLILALAACGSKSQKDVLTDLDKQIEEMTGYKAQAEMVLKTGEEPITYNLTIWHKKPSYYLVSLESENKEQNQMILRNDEGVYVLTPALNKSFRFQSDWPENNSQVYLMESLVSDILKDNDRTFEVKDNAYVFNTKTNYQNKNLYQQQITLNKKSLMPNSVKIMDKDLKVLVDIKFSNVAMNAKFDDNAFDMENNMMGARLDMPAMASKSPDKAKPMFPTYEPEGSSLSSQKEVSTEDGVKYVLTYSGDRSFTIIQEQSSVTEVTNMFSMDNGNPVSLGFALGGMTENSIAWSYNGMDFFLASNDLTQDEMIEVAKSIYAAQTK
jgi:outer membrane lipoprotein-sorting protein